MPEGYRLFYNDERTVMVRVWEPGESGHGLPGVVVEVATRDHSDHLWRPPVVVTERES